jgi:glutamine synthetase
MTENTGMLSVESLGNMAGSGEIETVLVVFSDLYGRFLGKRFDVDFFLKHTMTRGTHACDYLLTADMEMEPVPGYRLASWERGYGDFRLAVDLSTLRVASWLSKTVLVICDVLSEQDHEPLMQAPRSILKRQLHQAADLGYSVMAASELEYYLFQDSYRNAAASGYSGLEPAGWYLEDYHVLQGSREESFNGAVRRHLKRSGVPIESSKGEWGLGQHELNMEYSDILSMADRHVVFKQCLKEVADQMGVSVTFMAKYASDQAGSSCHLHLSLWHEGRNAFPGHHELGSVHCSEVFRWFLAGWMAHLPEMMVFYAPTVNSYKRYQPGSWAPTRIAWSQDNRTAGFRVVGQGESLRIECRVPGADCNPYLALAASLASGLDGIRRKLEPPPVFNGDTYQAEELAHVPRNLHEASSLFERSAFARNAFGAEVVEHYLHFFQTEEAAFSRSVTDWERKRYFERI